MPRAVFQILLLLCFTAPSYFEVHAGDSSLPIDPIGLGRAHSQTCFPGPSTQQASNGRALSNSVACPREKEKGIFSRFNFSSQKIPFNLKNARDVPSLLNQGGSKILQAKNEFPLLAKHLTAGIQVAYRDPFLEAGTPPSTTDRMGAQLILKGDLDNMHYRADYGYAGHEIGNLLISTPAGKIGGKFIWKWKLPLVTPGIEVSRFSDNVDLDPFRPRTVSSNHRFSLNWSFPKNTRLRLSYSRLQKNIYSQPQGPLTNSLTADSAQAELSLKHGRGESSWSSRYLTSKNSAWKQGFGEEIASTIMGRFRLLNPVDINPQLGFFRQTDSQQGTQQTRFFGNFGTVFHLSKNHQVKPLFEFCREINHHDFLLTDSFSAKFGYFYTTVDDSLHIDMIGKYVINQNSLPDSTPQTYDVALYVRRDLYPYFHLTHRQQALSLKISHNQRVDSISGSTPSGQTSAILLVSIAP